MSTGDEMRGKRPQEVPPKPWSSGWRVAGEPLMQLPPALEDSLPRVAGEPEGFHTRRTTVTGYPLMGSSDAERAESLERAARIRAESMRDHGFEGDGEYCDAMLGRRISGSAEVGFISMSVQCGYTRDMHPGGTPVELPPGRERGGPVSSSPRRKGRGVCSGWADQEDYGPRYE